MNLPRNLLAPSTKPTMKYYFVIGVFISSAFGFYGFRLPEIISMVTSNPMHGLMVGAGLFAIITLLIAPPPTMGHLVRRLGLIVLVLYQFKQEMDSSLEQRFGYTKNLKGMIAVVTGANSGIGFAISELLYEHGATIVMACKNKSRCDSASRAISAAAGNRKHKSKSIDYGQLETMLLDLADLASVKYFVDDFKRKFSRLDLLINNAGLLPGGGERTSQGLEMAFGAMHIGHFALTRGLLPLLQKPLPDKGSSVPSSPVEESRVLNIGSEAFLAGRFHDSLFQVDASGDLQGQITDNCHNHGVLEGVLSCCPILMCPITNGYARAKLAVLLHAQELQKKSDEDAMRCSTKKHAAVRRLVTATIHPGTVATNILGTWLASMSRYFAPVFLRTPRQAAYLILHGALSHSFVPGAYIDASGRAHDLAGFRGKLLAAHLEAFPQAANLSFVLPPAIKIFSLEEWVTNNTDFVVAYNDKGSNDRARVANYSTAELSSKLWDVSEKIVSNWEKKRPLFSS